MRYYKGSTTYNGQIAAWRREVNALNTRIEKCDCDENEQESLKLAFDAINGLIKSPINRGWITQTTIGGIKVMTDRLDSMLTKLEKKQRDHGHHQAAGSQGAMFPGPLGGSCAARHGWRW